MPIYEYDCEECGVFTRLAKLSESAEPATCPYCGEQAPRVISAPSLSLMTTENRTKWERNEKAQHEPRRTRRSSCGCTGTHTCGTNKSSKQVKVEKDPDAKPEFRKQSKKNARPWMLGH